jgi:aldehyde oxidoreductase
MSDKKVTLTVNGVRQTVTASPEFVLIDLLRNDLKLTATKQSCDRKGQCGACTVIVNNKAIRSCITKVADLEGAEVITVEGLGTPDNPHLIQEAFVLAGAIQCGFCTPGMIMATKALLDKNNNPDDAAIKKALTRTLCRCTGYKKIVDAVKLAGKFIRGETTPDKVKAGIKPDMIGESHPRPTAMITACGLAKFGGDYLIGEALELATVHSTEHHAKIKSIDTARAKKMPGVIGIMTAKDVPGTNRIRVMAPDQPILCDDAVRMYGDPVAIVAAKTRDQARAAAAEVKVDYEPLPVYRHAKEALAEGAYQIHQHSPNLAFTMPLKKGDAGKAMAEAASVVEADFSTQMNHQAPLEPETCVAYLNEDKELVVIGRSINIHAHKGQLQEALGYENIRYQEPFVGGQFGIKATISSEGIAAAAALYFKKPVRYIPSLEESMWMSSKRHAYSMKVKLGADAGGHIIAYQHDMLLDKGAYTTLAFIPISRSMNMLTGSYHIPNVEAEGKTVFTNDPPGGAARGAGPPQPNFAFESAVEMLAEKMGIDP